MKSLEPSAGRMVADLDSFPLSRATSEARVAEAVCYGRGIAPAVLCGASVADRRECLCFDRGQAHLRENMVPLFRNPKVDQ